MNVSRCSAGRRSWTRGCLTSIGPDAGLDGPLGEVAVADDLAASRVVLEVGVVVDPGGDLGLDGLGEHLTGPVPEELGEDVLAARQWHDADLGGRLAHGGVLLGLVGQFGVGQTSPRIPAAFFISSIHDFRQYLRFYAPPDKAR